MTARVLVVLLFAQALALAMPGMAAAQTATSFEELGRALEPGDTVVVTDVRGQRIRGRLTAMTLTEIQLSADGPQRFEADQIQRVERADAIWNGAVIGAAIGGAVAIAGFQATQGGSDDVYAWAYIGSWALPAGGAVAGALVDRATMPTVYVGPSRESRSRLRVAPSLAADRMAMMVAYRF